MFDFGKFISFQFGKSQTSETHGSQCDSQPNVALSGINDSVCLPPASSARATILLEESLSQVIDMRKLGTWADQLPLRMGFEEDPRFLMADIRCNRTTKLQHDHFDDIRISIVNLLSSESSIAFFTPYFGERRFPESIQFYTTREGYEMARHHHGPDDIFVIFHFEKSYAGGRYYEIHDGEKVVPEISPYSACIGRGGVEHGVEAVESGVRKVLVTSWKYSASRR